MPIVTSTKMFQDAYKNGYAIGAFNVNNMEIVQGERSQLPPDPSGQLRRA